MIFEITGSIRAYPGSEFVVANALVKWNKLEPNQNEINFSQGFSQKHWHLSPKPQLIS